MLRRFLDFIREQHLLPPGQKVLLAVSGGRDSVCMAHLFHSASIPFAIAHCNFHLRLGDCDRDQQFVLNLAARYDVSFFTTDFDTRAFAASHRMSIEEAARHLRYEYFSQILKQSSNQTIKQSVVATAHHRDDSVETFFLNLFRGTGISGLHGIRPVSQFSISNYQFSIIRPLLPFSRAEIDAFVAENHLEYVEDSTNAELDARRNQIRHRLMPLLRELYPTVDTTMAANIERLYDTEIIYKEYIGQLRSTLITAYPSSVSDLPFQILSLDLPSLRSQFSIFNFQFSILFELLHPFGFTASQTSDILAATENGKLFLSSTHIAELHRGCLLIAPDVPLRPGRHPQPGDRIRTKKGTRLLSDYLKDLGISRIERQYVTLQVSSDGPLTISNILNI